MGPVADPGWRETGAVPDTPFSVTRLDLLVKSVVQSRRTCSLFTGIRLILVAKM